MIHIDAFKAMHTYTIIQNKMIHTRYNDSNCFIQTYTTILAKRYDLHTSNLHKCMYKLTTQIVAFNVQNGPMLIKKGVIIIHRLNCNDKFSAIPITE